MRTSRALRVAILLWMGATTAMQNWALAQQSTPVDLRGKGISVDEIGPRRAIHLSAADLQSIRGLGLSVMLTVVVAEDGRVESAHAIPGMGPKSCYAEAERIEMEQTFRPFEVNGRPVRAKINESISIFPPEVWAAAHVPFPDVQDIDRVQITLNYSNPNAASEYSVTINGNGVVFFSGDQTSLVPGRHVAHISPEAVRELVGEFRNADYYSLKDSYTVHVFDSPIVTTSLTVNDAKKRVVATGGQLAGMPDAAQALQYRIDQVADTARWLSGDEQTLESLVADHWDFAAESKTNFRIYSNAIDRQDSKLIGRFLAAKAPVVAAPGAHDSPLVVATTAGDLALVQQMTAGISNLPDTILSDCLAAAFRSGNLELIHFWLDKGADPTKPTPPHEYRDEMSLLANAVASGKADVVRLALRYPVDINAPARRGDAGILFWALQNAKPDEIGDVMTALINAGADVNATQGGEYNAPVVFSACSAPAAFKSLFAAGVDVNSRLGKGFNSASRAAGETLLMYCATTLPAVRQLLADGADPTLVSTNGFTALKAAQRDCDECAAVIETAIEKSATVGSVGAKRKP